MTLGEKLIKLRKEHGYTQEQFADIMEVSRQSVGKWETDIAYPETDKLIKIGEIYDCSLDYLLKGNDSDIKDDDNGMSEEGEMISMSYSDRDIESDITKTKVVSAVSSVTALGCVIAYLCIGFMQGLWHPSWLVFFLIPIMPSLVEAIAERSAKKFAYPVLVAGVYLLLGFLYDFWHPGWVIFITLPIYYIIAGIFDRD